MKKYLINILNLLLLFLGLIGLIGGVLALFYYHQPVPAIGVLSLAYLGYPSMMDKVKSLFKE